MNEPSLKHSIASWVAQHELNLTKVCKMAKISSVEIVKRMIMDFLSYIPMRNRIWDVHKGWFNDLSWNITIKNQKVTTKHQSKIYTISLYPFFSPKVVESVEYEYDPFHVVRMIFKLLHSSILHHVGLSMKSSHSLLYESSSN